MGKDVGHDFVGNFPAVVAVKANAATCAHLTLCVEGSGSARGIGFIKVLLAEKEALVFSAALYAVTTSDGIADELYLPFWQ